MSDQGSQSLNGLMYIGDAFATRPALKVRGKEKSASFYGLIFTLLILGCLLAYSYHLAFDLLNHKHPSVFSCDQPGETIHNNLYVFTQDTFQMGFGLVNQTTSAPYMDNSIYTVKASLKVASSVPTTQQVQWNEIPLDIEPCKPSHASWDQKFTLSGLWCFKEQQSAVDKVYVRGDGDSLINIEFSRCDPKTSNVTCSSDIDAQLRTSTWQAYYTEWAMNPNLYKTPLIPIFQSFKAGLPSNLQRKVYLFLKTLLYETDAGWLTEQSEDITVVGVERINYDFNDREEDNPVFMSAEFVNSGNLLMHMRRYKKLAELFAQIEGLAVVLIPILGILVIPYSTFKMYEQATNDIYNIHKGGSGNKKRKEKRKGSAQIELPVKESEFTGTQQLEKKHNEGNSRQKPPEDDAREVRKIRYLKALQKINNNYDEANPSGIPRSSREFNQENLNQTETLQKSKPGNENKDKEVILEPESIRADFPGIDVESDRVEKVEKESPKDDKEAPDQDQVEAEPVSEPQPFSLSYFEWLKSSCRPDPRMKVITQARVEIEESIDVVGILKRFIEIDKLKECLLTQEQRVLFDNLRRPILTKKQNKISNEDKGTAKLSWQASYVGDVETARRVYEELKNKKSKTELDKKILALYKERNFGFTEKDLCL